MNPRKRALYVEGGGDGNSSLSSECRRAFSKLFEKAGIKNKPGVMACGGRKSAYDQFRKALSAADTDVWLLVDAEDCAPVVPPFTPWAHVKKRDGWDRPSGATDEQLHLMNVVMETWLLADRAALKKTFGPKLDVSKLPPSDASLEKKDKQVIYDALEAATKSTTAGKYGKGAHSFRTLAEVSPDALRILSWADRFLSEMGR